MIYWNQHNKKLAGNALITTKRNSNTEVDFTNLIIQKKNLTDITKLTLLTMIKVVDLLLN